MSNQKTKKLLPHPILSLSIAIIWMLLNNSFEFGHILLGAIVGFLIPYLTQSFWLEGVSIKRHLVFAKFLLVVLWDMLIANMVVARLIIDRNDKLMPGFMEIELDIKHPLGISILANTISLTPGTVSCDLNRDRDKLLVHALHVLDPKQGAMEIKLRYEKPLKEIFD